MESREIITIIRITNDCWCCLELVLKNDFIGLFIHGLSLKLLLFYSPLILLILSYILGRSLLTCHTEASFIRLSFNRWSRKCVASNPLLSDWKPASHHSHRTVIGQLKDNKGWFLQVLKYLYLYYTKYYNARKFTLNIY